jgi:hypothetical protein
MKASKKNHRIPYNRKAKSCTPGVLRIVASQFGYRLGVA